MLLDEKLSADHHVVKLYNILDAKQDEEQDPAFDTGDDTDDTEGDTGDTGDDTGDATDDTEGDTGDDTGDATDDTEGDTGDTGDDTEGDTDPSLEDLLNEDTSNGDSDDTGDTEGDTGDTEGDTGDTEGDTDDTGDTGDSGDTSGKSGDEAILDDFVGTPTGSDLQEPALDEGETLEEFDSSVEESNEQITLQEQLAQSAGLSDDDSGFRQLVKHRKQWQGLDWGSYVREWMTSRMADSWNKPVNIPTFVTRGIVEDDRESMNMGELGVVVDTSCSVPPSIVSEMLEAVQEALDTLSPKAIHLISSDHKVQEYQVLNAATPCPNH